MVKKSRRGGARGLPEESHRHHRRRDRTARPRRARTAATGGDLCEAAAMPPRRPRRVRAAARGRRRPLALVPTVTLTLALAGCGGHAATKRGVIARGNAICASANAAIRAVPSSGSATDAELGRYFSRVAPILGREAASLGKLPRPATDRAVLDAFVAAQARTAMQYARLATAARGGDQPAVQAALAKLAGSPVARLANRYGLSQCTGSAAATG